MADQERSDFFVAFTKSLCALELKQTPTHKFAVSSCTALKLGKQIFRSYFQLIFEYELHILPNTKVGAVKDHGKNYMKVRPPLARHLLRNRHTGLPNAGSTIKTNELLDPGSCCCTVNQPFLSQFHGSQRHFVK